MPCPTKNRGFRPITVGTSSYAANHPMRFLQFLLGVTIAISASCSKDMTANHDNGTEVDSDLDLCDHTYAQMIKHYGDDLDVSKCKESDQPVLLVWHAAGIIDNGGFQYLFEGTFKGDPYFARTAQAFKTIKAMKCAAAFDNALRLFPDSKPPTDIEKRLQVYQSVVQTEREAIDIDFFRESSRLKTLLAAYIRDHQDAITH